MPWFRWRREGLALGNVSAIRNALQNAFSSRRTEKIWRGIKSGDKYSVIAEIL